MGFLTSIFGGETNPLTIGFALIFVIVLIIAGVWILKMLFNVSGSMVRGRQKRLAVIDSLALDNKHNLLLVRRDDVEHLLTVSSSGVSVVETAIPTSSLETHTSPRETQPSPKEPKVQTPQENKASAERLGLTKIIPVGAPLAQTNEATAAQANIEPLHSVPMDEQASGLAKPHLPPVSENHSTQEAAAPPLRHTGLLRPVSEMVSVPVLNKTGETQDITPPSNDDSAINEVTQTDARAMESIEEGANPSNGKAKQRKKKNKPEAE